jgi:hypothetical protein
MPQLHLLGEQTFCSTSASKPYLSIERRHNRTLQATYSWMPSPRNTFLDAFTTMAMAAEGAKNGGAEKAVTELLQGQVKGSGWTVTTPHITGE